MPRSSSRRRRAGHPASRPRHVPSAKRSGSAVGSLGVRVVTRIKLIGRCPVRPRGSTAAGYLELECHSGATNKFASIPGAALPGQVPKPSGRGCSASWLIERWSGEHPGARHRLTKGPTTTNYSLAPLPRACGSPDEDFISCPPPRAWRRTSRGAHAPEGWPELVLWLRSGGAVGGQRCRRMVHPAPPRGAPRQLCWTPPGPQPLPLVDLRTPCQEADLPEAVSSPGKSLWRGVPGSFSTVSDTGFRHEFLNSPEHASACT